MAILRYCWQSVERKRVGGKVDKTGTNFVPKGDYFHSMGKAFSQHPVAIFHSLVQDTAALTAMHKHIFDKERSPI